MRTLLHAGIWLIAALAALPAQSQDHEMTTETQEITLAGTLVDRHFEIWNDTDKETRLTKFSAVYTEDILLADYAEVANGYVEAARLLERVQSQHPGFSFAPDEVSWNHGLGRVTWGYGPKDNPDLIRGEDIFTVRDGRLSSLHVFIDKK